MKKIFAAAILITSLNSCFLFGAYKKTSFNYTKQNKTITVPVLVPKGYKGKTVTTDRFGNHSIVFNYGKAFFYVTHVVDSSLLTQIIDYHENIPRTDSLHTLIFKGMDESGLFWREVFRPHLRVGYRYIPGHLEGRFDEATNFAITHTMPTALQQQGL